MAKKNKGVFEADRKMELRLRLAAKEAAHPSNGSKPILQVRVPEREMVDRIIDRVRTM